MDSLELIEQINEELNGKKGLFGKKPDLTRLSELVAELNDILPNELREAEAINRQRKSILENADTVAKNTIRTAEEKARQVVSQSVMVREAEDERNKIIENGYAQCDALIGRTKAHLDDMFREIEEFLLSNVNMVRKNREELRNFNLTPKNNVRK